MLYFIITQISDVNLIQLEIVAYICHLVQNNIKSSSIKGYLQGWSPILAIGYLD